MALFMCLNDDCKNHNGIATPANDGENAICPECGATMIKVGNMKNRPARYGPDNPYPDNRGLSK